MIETEIIESTTDETVDNQVYTTGQVAEMLGITQPSLTRFMHRHCDLRPALHPTVNLYLWTLDEIERVRERRNKRRKYTYKSKT